MSGISSRSPAWQLLKCRIHLRGCFPERLRHENSLATHLIHLQAEECTSAIMQHLGGKPDHLTHKNPNKTLGCGENVKLRPVYNQDCSVFLHNLDQNHQWAPAISSSFIKAQSRSRAPPDARVLLPFLGSLSCMFQPFLLLLLPGSHA